MEEGWKIEREIGKKSEVGDRDGAEDALYCTPDTQCAGAL